jgi:pimeloyl-ACP methyl ester carboxylesterase
MVTLTEDLRGLMDALGIRKAHLVGFSMGGSEISAMAGTHPERVDRLVYLDSAYDWSDPVWAPAFKAVPPSLWPTDKDRASLGEYRKFIRAVWFPSVGDPRVFEGYMRDGVAIQPNGSVQAKEDDNANEALAQTVVSARRDYTKIHSPALAIYAASMGDVTEHQRSEVHADLLAWEEKYVASFRTESLERARRELSNVEIMKVPCCHRDMVFACKDTIVAAMRRFLGDTTKHSEK